jgi:putative hemolysin
MSEAALIGLDDNKLSLDAKNGNKKSVKIKKFLSKPTRFLSTIQIGITFLGFLNGIIASDSYSLELINFFSGFISNVNPVILKPLVTLLITIVLSFFQVILGELVPKRIAMKYPIRVSYLVIDFIVFVSIILTPFVFVFTKSADLISLLFKIKPEREIRKMTEEEIKMIVTNSTSMGVLDKTESEMINNVIDFDDTTVGEIMTHRVNVIGFEKDSKIKDISLIIAEEQYSRYPIYEKDIDHIIGFINIKDIFGKKESDNISSFLRKAIFIPESLKVRDCFEKMRASKNHIMIVIDEFGGTSGIVTMEDLIEEIMGTIQDEYDTEEEVKQEGDSLIVDGLMKIDDLDDFKHLNLPVDEYDSLSGFLLDNLEENATTLTYQGFKYKVLEKDDRVILKVEITKDINEEKV